MVLLTIGQALGAAVALLGLFLLAGPAWTALVGGVLLLAVFSLAEWVRARSSRPGKGGA